MKKIISLLLALIMLMSLSVPAFAATGYYYADNWNDLVDFLSKLEDGDSYYIEVGEQEEGGHHTVRPKLRTACISADNVEIEFAERDFWTHPSLGYIEDPFFEITGDNVTLDFGGSELQPDHNSAIVVDGNDCTIKNAYFFYCNNPNGNGGGILITDNDPGCHIIDCDFRCCNAKCGGGVYIDADDAVIENCTFYDCGSTEPGADVYDNEGESIVKNCRTTAPSPQPFFLGSSKPSFYNMEDIQNCEFEWDGFNRRSSVFSEGNIWIIAGVAVAVIAVTAVVIVKKKKKKAAAAAETAEEAAETEE